jgi:tRNA G18 (ribose-2'-O)-methylase SpoU
MTLQPIPCEQADPALLAPYHNLKDRQLRAREGRFIAEGLEVVRRLLISRHEVCSVLATPNKLAALAGQLRPDVPAIAADLDTLLAITGFNVHRGVLACGRRPQNPNLHDAAAALPRQDTSLIVALEEVTDPINIGVIIRSAAAFGAHLVLLERCCDAYYRRAVRVSMGNVFRIPLRISEELTTDLNHLRSALGYTAIATVADPAATAIHRAALPRRAVLAFGAEGPGLSTKAIAHCDQQVTIPMAPGSDSLNAGVAAGICMHCFSQSSQT